MTQTEVSTANANERANALANAVNHEVANGWRVVSQTQTQAQLVKGKPTSHLLHFFIGLFTLGIWWIVWIFVAIAGGEKQRFLSVDEYGRVTTR